MIGITAKVLDIQNEDRPEYFTKDAKTLQNMAINSRKLELILDY